MVSVMPSSGFFTAKPKPQWHKWSARAPACGARPLTTPLLARAFTHLRPALLLLQADAHPHQSVGVPRCRRQCQAPAVARLALAAQFPLHDREVVEHVRARHGIRVPACSAPPQGLGAPRLRLASPVARRFPGLARLPGLRLVTKRLQAAARGCQALGGLRLLLLLQPREGLFDDRSLLRTTDSRPTKEAQAWPLWARWAWCGRDGALPPRVVRGKEGRRVKGGPVRAQSSPAPRAFSHRRRLLLPPPPDVG